MAESEINNTTDKKKVRFADNHETSAFEQKSERKVCWVSPESCNRNKEEAYREGREWARKGYDSLIDESFIDPAENIQLDLNNYVRLGDEQTSVRGLERHISAKHADERRFKRCQCVESVVDLCIYMRRKGEKWEEIEKEVASISLEHSKTARKFARRMAIADEVAVQGEEDMSSAGTSLSSEEPVAVPSEKSKPKMSFTAKTASRTKRLTRILIGQAYGEKR